MARRAWTQAAYSVYDPVLFEMLEVDAREFAVRTGAGGADASAGAPGLIAGERHAAAQTRVRRSK